jgi:Bacterial protein of unknown function (DUF885).
LIKRAKENLKTPAQLYTETAIKQIPYIIDFYKNEVQGLVASASEANKQLFLAEVNKVVPALEDYERYLKNELLPKSTGNFRLGPEVHRRLIQRLSGSAISQEEMISRATTDVKNIRREMFLVLHSPAQNDVSGNRSGAAPGETPTLSGTKLSKAFLTK